MLINVVFEFRWYYVYFVYWCFVGEDDVVSGRFCLLDMMSEVFGISERWGI